MIETDILSHAEEILRRQEQDAQPQGDGVHVITYNQFRQFNRCPILAYLNVDAETPYEKLMRKVFMTIAGAGADWRNFVSTRGILEVWDKEFDKIVKKYGRKVTNSAGLHPDKVRDSGTKKIFAFYKWINTNVKDLNDIQNVDFKLSYRITDDIEMRSSHDMLIKDTLVTLVFNSNERRGNPWFHPLTSKAVWDFTMWEYLKQKKNLVLDTSYSFYAQKRNIPYNESTFNDVRAVMRSFINVMNLNTIPGHYQVKCKDCSACGGHYYVRRHTGT